MIQLPFMYRQLRRICLQNATFVNFDMAAKYTRQAVKASKRK